MYSNTPPTPSQEGRQSCQKAKKKNERSEMNENTQQKQINPKTSKAKFTLPTHLKKFRHLVEEREEKWRFFREERKAVWALASSFRLGKTSIF